MTEVKGRMPKRIRGWAILLAVQALVTAGLTLAYKFAVKLIENAVVGWSDDRIAAWFGLTSPNGSAVLSWALPFLLAIASLFAFYRFIIWQHQLSEAAAGAKAAPPPEMKPMVSRPIAHEPMEDKPKKEKLTVTAQAPDQWERLFAVGDDDSIWLKFLPDTKKYKTDALLLILYGYLVLRGIPKVSVRHAHAQVQKSIDNAPNKPGNPMNWIFGSLASLQDNYEYADELLTWGYVERIDLSEGGRYKLTTSGIDHIRSTAYDLISRA